MTTPITSGNESLYTRFEEWTNKNTELVTKGMEYQNALNNNQSIWQNTKDQLDQNTTLSEEEKAAKYSELETLQKQNRNTELKLLIKQTEAEKDLGREFDVLDGKDMSEYEAQFAQFAQESMEAYDENQDGKVSYEEFESYETREFELNEEELAILKEEYNTINQNPDDGITLDEMQAYWETVDEETDGQKDGKFTNQPLVEKEAITVELDEWNPNEENNIDCASRLVENAFGVSFYLEEGQDILSRLQEINPDVDFDNLQAGSEIKLMNVYD